MSKPLATVLAAAVATCALGSGAHAQAFMHVMGYGDFAGGAMTGDFTLGYRLGTVAGGAYANLPLPLGWNVEGEFHGYSAQGPLGLTVSETGYFGHLYWRNQSVALGGFAGYSNLGLYGMTGKMTSGGAEARIYAGPVTIYGQVAALNASAPHISSWLYFTGYSARAAIRAFVGPVRLEGDIQRAVLDNYDHTVVISLLGTAEYQFTPMIAAFGTVRWDQWTPRVDKPGDTTTVLFGLRSYFGGAGALDNDRHGASMDVLPFPPTFALNFG